MGYNTDFYGTIEIEPEISFELKQYINKLAETRRMKRDVNKLQEIYKGEYGLDGDYGKDGEFFIAGEGFRGQSADKTVLDYNTPPADQPSLWLQWIINDDNEIEWDYGENFYCSIKICIISHVYSVTENL